MVPRLPSPKRGRDRRPRGRDAHALAGALVLASLTVITVDAHNDGEGSPVEPLRSAVGAVLGPVESGMTQAFDPVLEIPQHFRSLDELRHENAQLRRRSTQLQRRLDVRPAQRARDASAAGLRTLADTHGYDVHAAEVIAVGPAQSFRRTVTIDAGRKDGIVPDLMVINADGLVGRVVATGESTSTVLLIVDQGSTIGGRLSHSSEIGFLDGDGSMTSDGRLTLKLVDHEVTPRPGDPVLTWGSRNSAPYLPGVPVGRVESVRTSPADLTETARVVPYVDFSTLDVVGVVTAQRTKTGVRQLAGGGR